MQKSLYAFALVVLVFMTFVFFSSYTNEPETKEYVSANGEKAAPTKSADGTGIAQVVEPVPIPSDANLAGEYIPVDNPDARERLDRELMVNTYWQSATLQHIKLANRYFPTFERILAEEGVPDDMKYVAVIESGLRNVVSPSGARGLWQFMSATAKGYGLIVNTEVDERYHLEKSTRAAAKYLKKLHNQFGSWTMAAAAYNMGETRLRGLTRKQGSNNYYDIEMNKESARYVSRVVAVKSIMKNPSNYGFYLNAGDLYAPHDNCKIVEVKTAVADWAKWAKDQNISYRTLKYYNPWLREGKLTNTAKRTYNVKVPY